MWTARYVGDRIEQIGGGSAVVSQKVRAIVEQPTQTVRQPLFISESGTIPLRVAISVIERRRSLWGRYE